MFIDNWHQYECTVNGTAGVTNSNSKKLSCVRNSAASSIRGALEHDTEFPFDYLFIFCLSCMHSPAPSLSCETVHYTFLLNICVGHFSPSAPPLTCLVMKTTAQCSISRIFAGQDPPVGVAGQTHLLF